MGGRGVMVRGGFGPPTGPPPGSSTSAHIVEGKSIFLQKSKIAVVCGGFSYSNLCIVAAIIFGTPEVS